MGHGGARPGAGRKVGSATKKTREIADKAAAEGQTPLEYLLAVMRDKERSDAERFEAAKAAAPYIHPKLNATTVEASVHERGVREMSDAELMVIAAGAA